MGNLIDINSVGPALLQLLGRVLGALAIVIFGHLATLVVARSVRIGAAQARIKPALIELIVAGVRGIGLLIILSGALQTLGLDQIALAVGGSISLISLGIATAASGNLGDIIAGVFLASDPDFGTGFVVSSLDLSGVIEHVDLRKTRLRTSDGKLHIIPNKSIEGNPWTVESRPVSTSAAPLFRGFGRHPGQGSQQAPHGGTPPQPVPGTPPG